MLATLLGAGAACSDPMAGQPVPGGDTTPGTTTSEPPTESGPPSTSKTTGAGDSLASVEPCELLNSSAQSALGITEERGEDELGGARVCGWRVRKATAAESFTYTVAIYESAGLTDIVSDGAVKPMKVGSREAAESLRSAGGGCAISLAVTESSRVDVLAVGGDGAKLCAPALEAAKLVEPELP